MGTAIGIGDLSPMAIGDTGIIDKLWLDVTEHGSASTHRSIKRTLGDIILPDGTSVNQEFVKQGWCWWYRKYAPGNTALERLERAARDGRKGLWADSAPVPRWEWRKRK